MTQLVWLLHARDLLLLDRGLLIVLLLSFRDRGLLVLLVLGDQVIHVGLGLGKLHLVHALTSIPVQESFTPEHGSELVSDTLEKLLDRSRVTDEGRGHLKAARRDRTKSSLDIVGDPLHEVRGVLVLNIAHLVLDLLHRDLATEDRRAGEVPTVAEIRCSHHVLRVEHLLSEFGDGDGAEGVGATAGKGCEADHEEVQTRERNHVDGQLSQIRVQLTRETERGGDTRHDGGDKVVQITV